MKKKVYEKPSFTVHEIESKNLILLTSNPSFPGFDPNPNPYPYPIG